MVKQTGTLYSVHVDGIDRLYVIVSPYADHHPLTHTTVMPPQVEEEDMERMLPLYFMARRAYPDLEPVKCVKALWAELVIYIYNLRM